MNRSRFVTLPLLFAAAGLGRSGALPSEDDGRAGSTENVSSQPSELLACSWGSSSYERRDFFDADRGKIIRIYVPASDIQGNVFEYPNDINDAKLDPKLPDDIKNHGIGPFVIAGNDGTGQTGNRAQPRSRRRRGRDSVAPRRRWEWSPRLERR